MSQNLEQKEKLNAPPASSSAPGHPLDEPEDSSSADPAALPAGASVDEAAPHQPADHPLLGKEAIQACKAVAVETARLASKNAYVPYSHFPVGAAVILTDGGILPGCNVENASYGLTQCAERTALFNAIAQGYQPEDIMGLALYTPTDTLTTPCGACRQVIAELMRPDGFVLCVCDRSQKEYRIQELLPDSFQLDAS